MISTENGTKKIILDELFLDVDYKNCVIDILLKDKQKMIESKKMLSEESKGFLEGSIVFLEKEAASGNILFFRKYNYEKILNTYLEKQHSKVNAEISFLISEREKQRQLDERYILENITKLKWDKFEGLQKIVYKSSYKDKPIKFTIERFCKKESKIEKASFTYDNELFKYKEKHSDFQIQTSIEYTNPCCKNKVIVHVVKTDEKEKRKQEKKEAAIIRRKKEQEEARKAQEKKRLLKEKRRKEQEEKKKLEEQKKQEELLKKQEILRKKIEEEQKKLQELPKISAQDFVVRRAVFKCIHNKHEVVDLAAAVQVVGDDGKVRLVKVTAGYCKQCHIYFIMESTFISLRNMGVVLCRISDEKTYLKNGFVNGMRLASESILMQFGYNVSQQEGLSETRRQKILAVMIDNHVLSKSEIISYLDFFINQRQYQSKFELAISKWEADREFVQGYRIGEYTQFGVHAIYRR